MFTPQIIIFDSDSKTTHQYDINGTFKFGRKHTLGQFEQEQLQDVPIPHRNVQFQNVSSSVNDLGSTEAQRILGWSFGTDKSVGSGYLHIGRTLGSGQIWCIRTNHRWILRSVKVYLTDRLSFTSELFQSFVPV